MKYRRPNLIELLVALSIITTVAIVWRRDGTVPASQILSNSELAAKESAVRVVWLGQQPDGKYGQQRFTCALVNCGSTPVTYIGEESRPLDDLMPRYCRQKWVGEAWEDERMGWCGNCRKLFTIAAGYGGRFLVSQRPRAEPFRIGVHYTDHLGRTETAWSPSISAGSHRFSETK